MRRIHTARRCTCTSALALLLVACGGSERTIAWTDISAKLRGFQPARLVRQAFTNQHQFAQYVSRSTPGIHVPQLDWANREAILVGAGPRSSTGYVLRIVSVRQTAHHVIVTVHEDTPQLGQPVMARVTYPYRLITIPRTGKPLFLHWPGRP